MAALSDRHAGIALALGAAAFFGLSHSIVVLAYAGGTNPLTVSATRFILPILALLIFLAIKRAPILLSMQQGIWAIGLGVVTAIYTLALLMALDFLPAGIAMLVFYLFPILTGVIVAITGWAPLDRQTAFAAIVALLGLALTLGVRFGEYSLLGLALAALGALGLAIVSAASARIIAASDPLRPTIYMSAGALASLAAAVAVWGEFQWPTSGEGWSSLMLSHIFFAAALISYFIAVQRVGAATAATLGNLQPLVVIATAFVLLGQSLEPLQILGAIIVVGALVVAARSRRVATDRS